MSRCTSSLNGQGPTWATLAFLAAINQVPTTALGVTRFGQSGSLEDVCRFHGLDSDSIIRAALDLTD